MNVFTPLLVFGLSFNPFMSVAPAQDEHAAQETSTSTECAATLDAARFPNLVPEQFPWETLFELAAREPRRIARDLNVTAATGQLLCEHFRDYHRLPHVASPILQPDLQHNCYAGWWILQQFERREPHSDRRWYEWHGLADARSRGRCGVKNTVSV